MPAVPNNHEAERRLNLLKAAFREVAERGFSEVRLEDIARRAGVSKGVTLYYFASKEDLFRELFSWLIDSIAQRMREAVDRAPDPVEKVRALVALIFPSPARNRAFFRAYAGCREIDGGIVREGIRRGVFALRDPDEAASTLRAIFDGLMLQWLMEKEPETSFGVYRDRCERELLAYLLPAKSTRGKGKE